MNVSRRTFLMGATAAVVAAPAVAEATPQWTPQVRAWDLGTDRGTSVIYYGGMRGGGKTFLAGEITEFPPFAKKFAEAYFRGLPPDISWFHVPEGELPGAINRSLENMATFGQSVTRTQTIDDDWILIEEISDYPSEDAMRELIDRRWRREI